MSPLLESKALFGGAMEIGIPPDFINVDHLREVPDHQEVFSNVKTDSSLIIELLDLANETTVDSMAE